MATESFTETGLGIVLRPSYPSGPYRGARRASSRRTSNPGTGARVAQLLETAILIVAHFAIGLGLGLMAYGATLAISTDPGTPAPNVWHVSTYSVPPTVRR